ncbi:MAG: hypothetical protein WKF37_19575 [Bryobacteraceae bacterium]
MRAYRDIIALEAVPGVTAGRKFSFPPNDSDMSELVLSKADVEDLKACRPGKCAFKIGDTGLKFLRDAVNWNSPEYVQQATKALRSLWLQYLIRYQTTGDKGLAVYHDTSKYSSVEKGLHALLDQSTALREYAPRLREYLDNYPQSKNESVEEFFYWQVGEFGLKPVHRVTHVVIQRNAASLGEAYVIASKMLFANHYFQKRGRVSISYPWTGPAHRRDALPCFGSAFAGRRLAGLPGPPPACHCRAEIPASLGTLYH